MRRRQKYSYLNALARFPSSHRTSWQALRASDCIRIETYRQRNQSSLLQEHTLKNCNYWLKFSEKKTFSIVNITFSRGRQSENLLPWNSVPCSRGSITGYTATAVIKFCFQVSNYFFFVNTFKIEFRQLKFLDNRVINYSMLPQKILISSLTSND